MKSLIFILVCVSLISCQKKQCWTCSVGDSQVHGDTIYFRYQMPNPICDMTKKEIDQYANDVKAANCFYYTDSLGNQIAVHGKFVLVECH